MLSPAILSVFGAVVGTWLWRAMKTRRRFRELAWPAASATRLREIRDAIEGVALLQNVDPWGELAAGQVEKLSGQFREFEKLVVRRFASDWPRGREIHAVGAQAFWSELNRLERVATLLRKLDLSDPSFYRSILNSTLEPDEEPDLKQTAFAHTELEAHRKLEDEIQQELFRGEQVVLGFGRVITALDSDAPAPELTAAMSELTARAVTGE